MIAHEAVIFTATMLVRSAIASDAGSVTSDEGSEVGLATWCKKTDELKVSLHVFKEGVADYFYDLGGDHEINDYAEMYLTKECRWLRILNLQMARKTKTKFAKATGRYGPQMTKRQAIVLGKELKSVPECATAEPEKIEQGTIDKALCLDKEKGVDPMTPMQKLEALTGTDTSGNGNGSSRSSGTDNAGDDTTTVSAFSLENLEKHNKTNPGYREQAQAYVKRFRPLLLKKDETVYWISKNSRGKRKRLGKIVTPNDMERDPEKVYIQTRFEELWRVPKRFIADPITHNKGEVVYSSTGERFTILSKYLKDSSCPENLIRARKSDGKYKLLKDERVASPPQFFKTDG